jgi:hypothetical protein
MDPAEAALNGAERPRQRPARQPHARSSRTGALMKAQRLVHAISELPLVAACVVVGGVSIGIIGAATALVNALSSYPLAQLPRAALFGLFEGSLLGALAGCCTGLVVGVAALLLREAARTTTRPR